MVTASAIGAGAAAFLGPRVRLATGAAVSTGGIATGAAVSAARSGSGSAQW